MADTENTLKSDITFRGIDGNECESFVLAIRELAFANRKEGDYWWMLHFATTRLRGKALRWHATLDPSVQRDWDLFVRAMFEEWPLVEERDEDGVTSQVRNSNIFTPPVSTFVPLGSTEVRDPAPLNTVLVPRPRVYDPSAPGLQVGRLRIVYEEGDIGPHYVHFGLAPRHVAMDIHKALIVSFISSSEPHQIGCMNSEQVCSLGVDLFPQRQSDFHPLAWPKGSATPSTRDTKHISMNHHYQTVSSIWNILSDGTLRATLAELIYPNGDFSLQTPSEPYSTTTVYVEFHGATISFVKDSQTPRALHPTSGRPVVRARIVFEPI